MEQQPPAKPRQKKYAKTTPPPAQNTLQVPLEAQAVDPLQEALTKHFEPVANIPLDVIADKRPENSWVTPPEPVKKDERPVAVERKVNKLEKIRLLSDLANACSDQDIIDVFHSKQNGEKLYELFVTSISNEIEVIMNPNQKKTNELEGAAQSIHVILASLQRIGSTLGAIESGPTIMALVGLLNKLGGVPTPITSQAPRGTTPPQPPAPAQQPQAPRANQNFASLDTPNPGGNRGGGLGTW